MKNRIEKSTAKKRLKAKPQEKIQFSLDPLTGAEWERIRKGAPADERITVPVELKLTRLQYRAIYWYCRWLFITPSELATTAVACDLDGHNNTNEEKHLTYTLSDILAQFPERKKELGELFDAYDVLDNAINASQKRIRTITEKLEKAVAS